MTKGLNLYNFAKFCKRSYDDAKESGVMGYIIKVRRLYFDEDMLNALEQDGIKVGDYLIVKINLAHKSDKKSLNDIKRIEMSDLPEEFKQNAEPFKELEISSLSSENYHKLKRNGEYIPYFNKANYEILSGAMTNDKHIVNEDIAKKIYFSNVTCLTLKKELIKKDNAVSNL